MNSSRPVGLTSREPVLLTQRVTETFFERVASEARPVNSLTIVSPWLSDSGSGAGTLRQLCTYIAVRELRTLVISRPPEEDWHQNALNQLARAGAHIQLLPSLHAKVYVCEAIPVGFGLVGSANFTKNASRNYEVGIMFDGAGIHERLLKELRRFARYDLRGLATSAFQAS